MAVRVVGSMLNPIYLKEDDYNKAFRASSDAEKEMLEMSWMFGYIILLKEDEPFPYDLVID